VLGTEYWVGWLAAGLHTPIVSVRSRHVQHMLLCFMRKLNLTMLDVRKLVLLRELRARGTIAAVAEALAYTPSAVSQQLAQLQRETGVALTERVGRRLRLTDAGVRLVEHAGVLLGRLEEAEAELQNAAGEVHGRLKLASLQTPLLSLVAPALELLQHRHPHVRVELFEMEPERSLPAVVLGEYDVALAEEYTDMPRRRYPELERTELCRDPIVVALPRDHPAAARAAVSLRDLGGDAWLSAHADTQFAQSAAARLPPRRRLRARRPALGQRHRDLDRARGGRPGDRAPPRTRARRARRADRGSADRGRRPGTHDLRAQPGHRNLTAVSPRADRRPARDRTDSAATRQILSLLPSRIGPPGRDQRLSIGATARARTGDEETVGA